MNTQTHPSISHWAVLAPRTGFFAKDGRGWYAGSTNRAFSLPWPMPRTARGALCTATGRVRERDRSKVNTADEWLALKDELKIRASLALRGPATCDRWTDEHIMWPAPFDAVHVQSEKAPVRLRWWRPDPSVAVIDGRDDARASALRLGFMEHDGKPARGPAWWTQEEMLAWLMGQDDRAPPPKQFVVGHEPHSRIDTHVAIDPTTFTAEESMLWSGEFRETLVRAETDGKDPERAPVHRWAMALGVATDDVHQSLVACVTGATLAGDRRLANVSLASEAFGSCPEALLTHAAKLQPRALRLYTVTPTIFEDGWCPDGFAADGDGLVGDGPAGIGRIRITGAMMNRAMPVAGWSLQNSSSGNRGFRTVLWALPPGSVFGIEREDGLSFSPEQIQALWLAQWGQQTDDGFGLLIAGPEASAT